MFQVNDLVRVTDKEQRQHGYIGRVDDVSTEFTQGDTMYYVERLTSEKGEPYPNEVWDADWFYEDQLAAYELHPQVGQWLTCIDDNGLKPYLQVGQRYMVLSAGRLGDLSYVVVHLRGQVLPLTADVGRFSLVPPIKPRD